jgi:nuclear transcription factor Y gamma
MDQVNLNAHGQPKMRSVPAAPRRYDGQNGNPHYDEKHGGHYGKSSRRQDVGQGTMPELALTRPTGASAAVCPARPPAPPTVC